MKTIPYGKQNVSDEDIQRVVEVLQSDWLTQGPAITKFEETVAEYCGAKYAVAVSSATAALHIACLAADLGSGDQLWTSPNTFVASANCGIYCGAEVDFVDIDERTYNLCPETLKEKLDSSVKIPKVLIPVHFSGQSCEMKKISELTKEYGITIIEDASHGLGGSYQGRKIGSCIFSQMTVFSFHPVKIVTTGEGGIITTNSEELYKKLILLRSHGITRDENLMEGQSFGPWYYEQISLGYNYRITDIQAALGISQMQRIDQFIARRHYLAERYNQLLNQLPLILPWQHPDNYSAYHLYVIRLKLDQIDISHKEVFQHLRKSGINVNLHYIPVHTQPYYRRKGFAIGDFPKVEQYYSQAITLPLYYGLTEQEQNYVVERLKEVLK